MGVAVSAPLASERQLFSLSFVEPVPLGRRAGSERIEQRQALAERQSRRSRSIKAAFTSKSPDVPPHMSMPRTRRGRISLAGSGMPLASLRCSDSMSPTIPVLAACVHPCSRALSVSGPCRPSTSSLRWIKSASRGSPRLLFDPGSPVDVRRPSCSAQVDRLAELGSALLGRGGQSWNPIMDFGFQVGAAQHAVNGASVGFDGRRVAPVAVGAGRWCAGATASSANRGDGTSPDRAQGLEVEREEQRGSVARSHKPWWAYRHLRPLWGLLLADSGLRRPLVAAVLPAGFAGAIRLARAQLLWPRSAFCQSSGSRVRLRRRDVRLQALDT